MTKQQILDQITEMATDEESVSDLVEMVSAYPEELSEEMLDELTTKVDEYVADNTMLEKAYADLAAATDAAADTLVYSTETVLQEVAQKAHSDIAFAQDLLDQE